MPRRARGCRPMAAAPGSPCPPAPLPPGCPARPRHRPPRPDPRSPPLPEPTAPLPAAGRVTHCGKLGRRPCRRLPPGGKACRDSSRQDPKACPCQLTAAAWTGRLSPAPRSAPLPVPSLPAAAAAAPAGTPTLLCERGALQLQLRSGCRLQHRLRSGWLPAPPAQVPCAREGRPSPQAPPPRAHARSALCNNLHKE